MSSFSGNHNVNVRMLFGVFFRGDLESVEFTHDDAKETALNLSSHQDETGRTVRPQSLPLNRYIKPVFLLETDLNSHFLFSLNEALMTAMKELKEEEIKENLMVSDAVKEKTHLPDNYWQRRHKAWIKVEALRRAITGLEQEAGNMKFSLGA